MYSSVNTIWVLFGTALVFFMQAGFSLCEAGFIRAKNTGNILMKNLMDFCIGTPAFWLVGFRLMFGKGSGIIGSFDPLIRGRVQPGASFRRSSVGVCDLPDCLLCDIRHDCVRSNGRENKIQRLLYLFCSDLTSDLSGFWPLDLGRRMAFPDGIP